MSDVRHQVSGLVAAKAVVSGKRGENDDYCTREKAIYIKVICQFHDDFCLLVRKGLSWKIKRLVEKMTTNAYV
jgi:hypothetical protein